MNLIISNIGWFAGAIIIVLLALIGYYADKKEKQTQKEEPKVTNNVVTDEKAQIPEFNDSSNSENQTNMPSLNDIFNNQIGDKLQEQPIISEIDTKQQGNQSGIQEISEPIEETKNFNEGLSISELNNVENLQMSLEDLEKKNYNDILNKKVENEEMIPDFTNGDDYLDETLASLDQNDISHEFDNEIEGNNIGYTNNEQNENVQEEIKEENFNADNSELIIPTQNSDSTIEQIEKEKTQEDNSNEILGPINDMQSQNTELLQENANTLNSEIEGNNIGYTNNEQNENVQEEINEEKFNADNSELIIPTQNSDSIIEQIEKEKTQEDNGNGILDPTNDMQSQNTEPLQEDVNTLNSEIEQKITLDNKEDNNVWDFNKDEKQYQGEIPELFSDIETPANDTTTEINSWKKIENNNEENSSNLYNNTTDDDIWKF